MPKKKDWTEKLGAYTTDKVKLNRQPDKGYVKPVSILNRVNTAAHQDSGFSGKLPKGE